ncbi:Hypothetical protein NTJ_02794 [Nesidiocoris tenuis]|uniref:Death domain-containing protein n=1 Tax=Nesidiocoris tenuis TaxID=355587 RepID=A0ABN7AFG9_9HEMI|nr:Hypothetical protein NTJ_02794 [Nesidiocoris tenuis]
MDQAQRRETEKLGSTKGVPPDSFTSQEKTPFTFTQEESKKPNFTRSQSEGTKKTKTQSKKTPRTPPIQVTKFSHCNGIHIGSNYTMQNFHINGVTSSSKSADGMTEPVSAIPKEVLRCSEPVTDDDCQAVCPHVKCGWEILGQQLFFKQFNEIKSYLTGIDGKPNEEAVRLILIKWRHFSGIQAKVGRLCKVFQAANEIKAIKALAKRHGFVI